MASDIVKETARQVLAVSKKAQRAKMVAMDEVTLRVSLAQVERGRYYRNIDIAYNRGQDLYDLTIYTMDRQTLGDDYTEEHKHGVFFDMLGELIDREIHERRLTA